MKIRMGFVSNSSSSSFCIYGVCVDLDLKEIVKRVCPEEYKELVKELKEDNKDFDEEDIDTYELNDIFDEYLSKQSLEINNPYDNSYYIGRSWSDIDDNETGKQFKENVKAKVEKILGKKATFDTHAEAWRDG